MSLQQDFEENVVSLVFYKPTMTKAENNAKITSHSVAFEVKKGIFQKVSGSSQRTTNGYVLRDTDDCFVDKDSDTNEMYAKIRRDKEVWKVEHDYVKYEITSIEAAGEAEDPYIMEVKEVKT